MLPTVKLHQQQGEKKKKFDEIRSNFVLQELPAYSIEGFSAVLLSKFSHQITCDRKPSTQEKTEN